MSMSQSSSAAPSNVSFCFASAPNIIIDRKKQDWWSASTVTLTLQLLLSVVSVLEKLIPRPNIPPIKIVQREMAFPSRYIVEKNRLASTRRKLPSMPGFRAASSVSEFSKNEAVYSKAW